VVLVCLLVSFPPSFIHYQAGATGDGRSRPGLIFGCMVWPHAPKSLELPDVARSLSRDLVRLFLPFLEFPSASADMTAETGPVTGHSPLPACLPPALPCLPVSVHNNTGTSSSTSSRLPDSTSASRYLSHPQHPHIGTIEAYEVGLDCIDSYTHILTDCIVFHAFFPTNLHHTILHFITSRTEARSRHTLRVFSLSHPRTCQVGVELHKYSTPPYDTNKPVAATGRTSTVVMQFTMSYSGWPVEVTLSRDLLTKKGTYILYFVPIISCVNSSRSIEIRPRCRNPLFNQTSALSNAYPILSFAQPLPSYAFLALFT